MTYEEDYYHGYGYEGAPPGPSPGHNHYYMPENQFDYVAHHGPMNMVPPGHLGYPMVAGPPHMGGYMPQQPRQGNFGPGPGLMGGVGPQMGQPGYYMPVQHYMEPTPEPEVKESDGEKEEKAEKAGVKESGKLVENCTKEGGKGEVENSDERKNGAKVSTHHVEGNEKSDVKKDTSGSTENESQADSSKTDDSAPALTAQEEKLARKEILKQEKIEKQQKRDQKTVSYVEEIFQSKLLADTVISVNSVSLKAHSIFLARSEKLKQKLLQNTENPQSGIKMTVEDPGNWINDSCLNSVIATLYGLPLPSQMRQAQWFGAYLVADALGLKEVLVEIETALKKQIVTTQATITALNSVVQRCMPKGNSVTLPVALTKPSELQKLFGFLLSCLGTLTQSSISDLATSSLVKSPFCLYKVILETSQLFEGNTMEKYTLAKKLMQPRSKSHPGYQDVAVLAFSSDNDGLEIRRKKV